MYKLHPHLDVSKNDMRPLGYHGHCPNRHLFRLHSMSPAWRDCRIKCNSPCEGKVIIYPCFCRKRKKIFRRKKHELPKV